MKPSISPIWYCGFRPFFLVGAISSVLTISLWIPYWLGYFTLPTLTLVAMDWHAYSMLSGMVLAAATGFLMTAMPVFSDSRAISRKVIKAALVLWFVTQLGVFIGQPGLVAAVVANVMLVVLLNTVLLPRVIKHLHRLAGFAGGLFLLLILTCGMSYELLVNGYAYRWFLLLVGFWVVMVVVAMSRVSMRMVNLNLTKLGESPDYLARPPRRNLAIGLTVIYSLAEFTAPGHTALGYLAFAVAAAFFNLLNDWHLGRVVFRRYVFILYLSYLSIACGYMLMGLAQLPLNLSIPVSAGRHAITIGGFGFAILAVFLIAGRSHAGFQPDTRRWVWFAIAGIAIALLARVLYGINGNAILLYTSAFCWCLVFLAYLAYFYQILTGPRPDGKTDCSGPQ